VGQVVPLRREFADLEPWVSKKEIASYFGVTTTTIDVWTNLGMPHERIGKRRKFRQGECDDWHRARNAVRMGRPRLERLRRVWAAAVEEWRR
jgi:hypothetical protein